MPAFRTIPRSSILVLLLAFFAFAMSAILSRTVFERLPHLEDEVAYLYQARVFAAGEVVAPIPEPRRAFWQPFVVDYDATGARFGKYTPGWPAILSIGLLLGQGWLVSAWLAALSVVLLYRLAAEIFGVPTGLFAAALMAFSPAALLLNASLMGHTASLFCALVFIYACWRIERGRLAFRWGLVGGTALGLLVITRPLTALAIALPWIIWSGLRLLQHIGPGRLGDFWRTLRPLLALSALALLVAVALPLFNDAATGEPAKNLYTLVWDYDSIGFGECCGRNGHNLERAIRHARYDLSLTAADLFGWQIGALTPEVETHLLNSALYYPNLGLSFLLLLPGLLVGALWGITRRQAWKTLLGIAAWMAGAVAIVLLPLQLGSPWLQDPAFAWGWLQDPAFAWGWLLFALAWACLPLLGVIRAGVAQRSWTWLMLAMLLSVVIMQMAYWIGSQRYSTRYYFEALPAAAILSGLALHFLWRWRPGRLPLSVAFAALLAISFFGYSLPRVNVLYRFNGVGQHVLEEVEARRNGDQPVLVLVTGPGRGDDRVLWRATGTLMAVTTPWLDSDIVVAWDFGGVRDQILARFPDRQIIEMTATGNQAVFVLPG